MHNKLILTALIGCLLLLTASSTKATTLDGKKYGIGVQIIDGGASGIGMTVDIGNRPVSLQPVLGFNDFPTIAGRLRYAFMRKRFLDGYAYGMIGAGEDDLFGGAGAGVEWDWRMLDRALPPVSWSFEIGYNTDHLGFGVGVHYTF